MAYEFRFPDIGEGVTEGELLAWKVAEGDPVAEGDTLAEVETDKAVVELPSPRAGRVAKLHAAEGDVIEVGAVVVTIDETVGGSPTDDSAQPQVSAGEAPYTGSVVGTLEEAPAEEVPPPASPPVAPPVAPPTPTPSSVAVPPVAPPMPGEPGPQVLAMPSVRALAKELGVDLSTVRGTRLGDAYCAKTCRMWPSSGRTESCRHWRRPPQSLWAWRHRSPGRMAPLLGRRRRPQPAWVE